MNQDAHIKDNIETAKEATANHLTDDEVQRIENVRDIFNRLTKVPCTGCGYCMPCPVGVQIPIAFEKYNSKSYFGGMESKIMYLTQAGGILADKPGLASQCVNCGKCETNCPQHIEIRKELKNAAKALEGPMDKPLLWVMKKVMGSRKKD
jgi:predicted aldo/keto reductase-like oxidoreductase